MATWQLLLVVCINNMSILQHFWDTAIFTVYTTTCNLEKLVILDKHAEWKLSSKGQILQSMENCELGSRPISSFKAWKASKGMQNDRSEIHIRHHNTKYRCEPGNLCAFQMTTVLSMLQDAR